MATNNFAPKAGLDSAWKSFTDNAFFFLGNADKILSDSRMYLARVHMRNGLAYIGTSDFDGATLGVYIEWWMSCDKAFRINSHHELELVVQFGGSPLSGCNRTTFVDKSGKLIIGSVGSFSALWRSFASINKRPREHKPDCKAYTLEEVLDTLKAQGSNPELAPALANSMMMKNIITFYTQKLEKAHKEIDQLREEAQMEKVESILDKARDLYKEYVTQRDFAHKEREIVKQQRHELRLQFKAGELSQKDYQYQLKDLSRRVEHANHILDNLAYEINKSHLAQHGTAIRHIVRYFELHPEKL